MHILNLKFIEIIKFETLLDLISTRFNRDSIVGRDSCIYKKSLPLL